MIEQAFSQPFYVISRVCVWGDFILFSYYMKKLILTVFSLLILFSSVYGRDWTERTGRIITGSFLDTSGTHVTIKRASDQKEFVILITEFSDKDQQYLKKLKAVSLGKYSVLLKTIEKTDDAETYKGICDERYWPEIYYAGVSAPAGYWVYSAPTWYIWGKQDLSKIGFEVLKKEIRLKNTTLEVIFGYHKKNKLWAEHLLDVFAKAIPIIERKSNIPFPGYNPYRIYETPELNPMGQADELGIDLSSPPEGDEWVMLHEMIHIWNSGGSPNWFGEGLANFISYQVMLELKLNFHGDETYPEYIKEWRANRESEKDVPMNDPKDNYYSVRAGKAMDYWMILHNQIGQDFVNECFRKHCVDDDFSNLEFEMMLKSYKIRQPKRIMQGWITKGEYPDKDLFIPMIEIPSQIQAKQDNCGKGPKSRASRTRFRNHKRHRTVSRP